MDHPEEHLSYVFRPRVNVPRKHLVRQINHLVLAYTKINSPENANLLQALSNGQLCLQRSVTTTD
jgi:hypothetical protein